MRGAGRKTAARRLVGSLGESMFIDRKAAGVTMVELAKRSGVTRQSIYAFECGGDVMLSTFVSLCVALKLEPHEVLARSAQAEGHHGAQR